MVSLPVSSALSIPEAAQSPVAGEVFRGLTSHPKTLSPWLFYDAEGSRLFEQITELDEYYVTRTERQIFAEHAAEIIEAIGPQPITIVELGAGTATKTGLLLRAAVHRQSAVTYCPIDVSATALEEARERIEKELPGVTVECRVADYTTGLGEGTADGNRRVILYIGSSIGNFHPPAALELLRDVRRQLKHGETILLGVDKVKDRSTLLRAYDDAAGVTAAFNKNILNRINRELGSNFNLRLFRHRARWNEHQSRIEMHLESLIAQHVTIPALDLEVRLARGETIHTENSYKYSDERVRRLLEAAGFRVRACWTDPKSWFGEYLAVA